MRQMVGILLVFDTASHGKLLLSRICIHRPAVERHALVAAPFAPAALELVSSMVFTVPSWGLLHIYLYMHTSAVTKGL